jgi:Glu-tRNA(Gln) amidotransferase subunit E-like FAD-binding protein
MSKIDDHLKEILGDAAAVVKGDLRDMIKQAKQDSSEFIKNQGKSLERYVAALANGEITKEEFADLVKGLASLHKIEAHRLSAQVKVRAQELSERVTQVVIEGVLKMV